MALTHPPQIDNGVILTVGVVSGPDRVAVVMPLISDDPGLTFATRCTDAVASWVTNIITALEACMSEDAYISYVSAEGAIDGNIPFRTDFLPTDHPGTVVSVIMPNNVTGLTVFYGDPADITPGDRMVVGKSFWPGMPASENVGDQIDATLHGHYNTLANALRVGFNTQLGGGKWYRVASLGGSRAPGTEGIGCIATVTRNYVATQRRRLTPH